ncbi:HAD family hydrolase [Clostridium sp. BJN0001]|uniref:HAD family hydrolase n=1 Tax=Clostridium sp. BJN0001 TaxID=2930219 RepID=UPI001FD30CA0|nr:HAD family hydrolase [Clostridium sp. BJN0001]
MIKMLASDLDGTLLNSEHVIDDESTVAIKKAQEKGLIFVVSTGRDYEMVLPLLKKQNIVCECSLMNGAEYRDENGKILESINMEPSLALRVIDVLREHDISSRIFTNKGSYTINTREEALREVACRTVTFSKGITFEEAMKKAAEEPFFTSLHFLDNNYEEFFRRDDVQIRKFVAFNSDTEKIKRLAKEVSKIKELAVSSSFKDNIEITHVTAQKGILLKKIAKKRNLKDYEVAVIGDSLNDYSMFTEFKDTSVAMANAMPEIKKIAKYMTKTNDEHGVAEVIYNILGGKLF